MIQHDIMSPYLPCSVSSAKVRSLSMWSIKPCKAEGTGDMYINKGMKNNENNNKSMWSISPCKAEGTKRK